ncbi:hypothetical protein J2Y44_003067 [Dyadobacter sp. BE32]|uniref:Uncharacterized protein n=2 Tax=Dyadobacter TaxID=120831 RepID=A0ABU1R1T8_9BACT|nr:MULTISPECIES: hypothetical protein [Dyadobacter]MDR6806889.1 hypothetical protein [Dyadobacter fermentans]MDR7263571.1 hypothetical protein [Dyadobacter sp. BE32]
MKLFWTFSLMLFAASVCYAQKCPNLPRGSVAIAGDLGYKPRGKYCEGLITESKVNGAVFDIASFTSGPVNFFDAEDEVISLGVSPEKATEVDIIGVSYNLSDEYRLDVSTTSGSVIQITARNVIAKRHIKKENLGFHAYYASGGEQYLIPVTVSSLRINTRPADRNYKLRLAGNVSIKAATYKLLRVKNGESGGNEANASYAGRARVLGPRLIEIDINRSIGKGLFKLEVTVESFDGYKSDLPARMIELPG